MTETTPAQVVPLPVVEKKHLFTVKRMMVGLALAAVAAASAYIARSELFASNEENATPADTSTDSLSS